MSSWETENPIEAIRDRLTIVIDKLNQLIELIESIDAMLKSIPTQDKEKE